jgi:sulfite exporter TauE/SafE
MEASMNFMNKFFMVLVIGRTMLSYVIIGAIASLVGAAVTKKNPRPIEIDR